MATWSSNLSKREIVDLLGGKVPVGPANTLAEVLADPHVEARRKIERYDHPASEPGGTFTASPIKFLNAPTRLYQRPPTHGEHTPTKCLRSLESRELSGAEGTNSAAQQGVMDHVR